MSVSLGGVKDWQWPDRRCVSDNPARSDAVAEQRDELDPQRAAPERGHKPSFDPLDERPERRGPEFFSEQHKRCVGALGGGEKLADGWDFQAVRHLAYGDVDESRVGQLGAKLLRIAERRRSVAEREPRELGLHR